jgi:hypothetical protein
MQNVQKQVSWDDNICEVIHEKGHETKSCHIDIKHHLTWNTIFSVVIFGIGSLGTIVHSVGVNIVIQLGPDSYLLH